MEKLFYKDRYMREFTAEVLEVKDIDNKYHVLLNETAFFPGGGGQFNDTGFIENIPVVDVYEDGEKIYHVLEKKLIKIHRVKCSIDWERRQDGMNQHLAQHVLSGCFYKLFNANTVSFHLGSEISTVDIEGVLNEEQIREAELMANKIISDNVDVEFITPTKKELKKIKLRRSLPSTDKEITVVKIGDLDINACCGVHPEHTLDLRMIKVKKYEKNKQATRIEFLAGKRAVDDSLNKDNFLREICKFLSSNEEEAIKSIKNLSESLKEITNEKRKIEEDIAKYEIKEMIQEANKINNICLIKKVYENKDVKYIQKLANNLCEEDNIIALLILKNDDRANVVFASSKNIKKISMGDLLKDGISLIDGKGGGSFNLAQGAGKNNINLDMMLDYCEKKLNNILS